MQIEIKIDTNCKETKVIVVTEKITDDVNALIRKIADETPQILTGFQGDLLEILDQQDIFHICVSLTNGTVTYVSRRYVSKIKQVLGI